MKKRTIMPIIIVIILVVAIITISIKQDRTNQKSSLNAANIVCNITDSKLCKNNQDCICIEHAGCFIGNKNYYEKCIAKTGGCFDLCMGWEQKPAKCINNECSQDY